MICQVNYVPPEKLSKLEQTWEYYMFAYGLVTLLYVLGQLEHDEFFEECADIISATHAQRERIGILATRLDDTVINAAVDKLREATRHPEITEDYCKQMFCVYAEIILYDLGYVKRTKVIEHD